MSVLACKAGRFDSITSSARSKTADNRCVEKDRDQVATPARLRAMAARERHVGRIVGRAYGYRPKRSAGKAVSAVHRLLRCGYTDVVDVPAELPGS